ncbi:hypothetical protein NBRC116600_30290 [Thalassotalea sp. SU-HH00458]
MKRFFHESPIYNFGKESTGMSLTWRMGILRCILSDSEQRTHMPQLINKSSQSYDYAKELKF